MAIALCVSALGLSGCGGDTDAESEASRAEESPGIQPVALTLARAEGPESAGFLMAEKRGYFEHVGLDVAVLVPGATAAPIEYVIDGTDDVGVSHLPQVVLAKARGRPIIAVGSLVPRPTAAMIWLKGSKIGGIADLAGKTIVLPGLPFQKEFLQRVLAGAGLTLGDVKVVGTRFGLVTDLIRGWADAAFGGTWNIEGVELEHRGLDPVITPVSDLGLPLYDELVVIARADRVAKEPELFRDFMSALARGTAAAIENPEGAASAIERGVEAEPFVSRELTLAELDVTLPLLSETGYMSPVWAERLVDWMHDEGMIQRKVPVSALLTNEFVGIGP